MRAIWSALVVLVLLAPFGGVGITTTPIDTEIVASPRGPAASLGKLRLDSELPWSLAVAVVAPSEPRITVRCCRVISSSSPIVTIDRRMATSPRAPPA